MQPYLFPYPGYFDLIRSVDRFVIYDDAQYMKGGWINRNNFPTRFTFRLAKHSNFNKINECYFHNIEEDKIDFNRKTGLKADRYLEFLKQEDNISVNITRTLRLISDDLHITTPFFLSSQIPHGKFVQGVIDIVKFLEGDTYINLPGGKSIYNQDQFDHINLQFIETSPGPSVLYSLCQPLHK